MQFYIKPSVEVLCNTESVLLAQQYSFGLNFTPCLGSGQLSDTVSVRVEDSALLFCYTVETTPTQEEIDALNASVQSHLSNYNFQFSCEGDTNTYRMVAVSGEVVYGSPCGSTQTAIVIHMEFPDGMPTGDCGVTSFIGGLGSDLCADRQIGGDLQRLQG
ncbi:MAG: hypothetical protein Q8Q33_08380 [Chlamydiota bacterium]|nr:hypothetical protein [Chlamydiota bacterium]